MNIVEYILSYSDLYLFREPEEQGLVCVLSLFSAPALMTFRLL